MEKKKKKQKKHKGLRILYLVCVIIVVIAGIYYENGYTDVNTFISDLKSKVIEGFSDQGKEQKQTKTVPASTKVYKKVDGNLEMHIIDVGQRRQYSI